jgi:hypothetical protein
MFPLNKEVCANTDVMWEDITLSKGNCKVVPVSMIMD